MSKELIDNALTYAKEFFQNDTTGHDFYHTLRVYNLAKRLAESEPCDSELVALGAILHDIDDPKLVEPESESFLHTKTFLESQNYPRDRIAAICHLISQVSYSKNTIPDTTEGKIVQDADRLDAIGAIGIARVFALGSSRGRPMYDPRMNPDDYESSSDTTIRHFYEKLLKLEALMNTRAAQQLARHRHEYLEQFLTEFYAEWDGKA